VDLHRTREAGLELKPFQRLRRPLQDEPVLLGPRADQAHVSLQHVEELGQLVQRRGAQQAADARRARIALRLGDPHDSRGVGRRGGRACDIEVHGAELEHRERPHVLASPHLPEEHRPAIIGPDEQGDQREQGRRDEQEQAAGSHIRRALEALGGSAARSRRRYRDRRPVGLDHKLFMRTLRYVRGAHAPTLLASGPV
jgi:hypothetical protein